MKSPLRSRILIASLAANVALAAFVLVSFLAPRGEPTASPVRDVAPLIAAKDPSPAPQVAAAVPEAVSSPLPAPAAVPVSQPAIAPISAPPALATVPPISTSPQRAQGIVSSGIPSSPSYQASRPPAVEEPDLGPARPVNSSAPGNSFISRGVRVAVAETYPTEQGGGTPLGIDLSPAGDTSSEDAGAADSTSQTTVTSTGSGNQNFPVGNASSNNPTTLTSGGNKTPDPDKAGFTNEEELFRMKWGWAAYDAAQGEARREADNSKNR